MLAKPSGSELDPRRSRRYRWRTGVASVALVGAIGARAPAAAQPLPATTDAVEVRVVDVDVVVLDRRGRPVLGLAAGDFRLFEDGRPVEIAYFSGPGADVVASSGEAQEDFENPERTEQADAGTSRPAGTLAFLLDDRLLPGASRRRVLADLEAFLGGLGESFERLVFGRYRDRLELVEPATTETILSRLAEERPLAMAAARNRDLDRAIDSMVTSHEVCEFMPGCTPCFDNWHELVNHARNHSYAEEVRLALALDALAELIFWLAGLEGEKLLVYPSAGLPHRPGIEAFAFAIDLCASRRPDSEFEVASELLQLDESSRLRNLGAWANARSVRLFPLDAGGLRAASWVDVEFASPDVRPSIRFDEIARTNAQSGLHQLAAETGGRAVLNSNRALADLDLGREIAARYSLGFVPAHPPTGRRHELRVEMVSARGKEIRYRRSYFDRTLEQRLADELQTVLRLGSERDELSASLAFGSIAPDAAAHGSFQVPVQLTLAADSLLHMPVGAPGESAPALQGRLRVWLGALRDDGTRTALRQETFTLGAPGLLAVEGRYRVAVTMPLSAGRWTVAAGLRDEMAQQTSLLRGVVEVGADGPTPPPDPR